MSKTEIKKQYRFISIILNFLHRLRRLQPENMVAAD